MKKLLFLFAILSLTVPGFSTDYYVKNGGNDSASGLDDDNAWETLSKIQSALPGNQPDTTINLKCGSIWREQATLNINGTSGHPFTIGQYGVGDDPKIMGSEQITTWEVHAGDVWKADIVANDIPDPGDFSGPVWFINAGDGKTYWGNPEAALLDVDTEYDWYWESDVLYCYAATDPDSRYTSVEAAMRRNCITNSSLNNHYWYIRDIEMCFTASPSFAENNHADYGTIDGCYIHHSGREGLGDNIRFSGDGWTIKNNVLHDGPSHNVQYYGTQNVSSILIENNTCYNSGHASIDCKHVGGVGVTSNVTIRYNFAYMTDDYAWPDETNASVSIQSNQASRMVGVDIYENIIVDVWKNGIFIYTYVEDVNIYNNSIYGEHGLSSFDGRLINISGGAEATKPVNVAIKNNIMAGALDATGYGLFIKYNGAVTACDYNCFYVTTGHYAQVPGTTYEAADWEDWKTDTGFDTNSIWNDNPDFVNPGTLVDTDYKLQLGSPCIDAGDNVGLSEDYFSISLPQGDDYDIGAAEYGEGDTDHKGSIKPGNKLIIKPGGKVIIKEPLYKLLQQIARLTTIGGLT